MAVSCIKAVFETNIEKVWDIVTSLEDYSWRSDIKNIEILECERQFIEYTKNGYATKFTITVFQPYQKYEFDMENDNMEGHWSGVFLYRDGKTTIEFTEHAVPKRWIFKPFVKLYLKKQQSRYVDDLHRRLEHQ